MLKMLAVKSDQVLFHVWDGARHRSKGHICHEPCYPRKISGLCFSLSSVRTKNLVNPDPSIQEQIFETAL